MKIQFNILLISVLFLVSFSVQKNTAIQKQNSNITISDSIKLINNDSITQVIQNLMDRYYKTVNDSIDIPYYNLDALLLNTIPSQENKELMTKYDSITMKVDSLSHMLNRLRAHENNYKIVTDTNDIPEGYHKIKIR